MPITTTIRQNSKTGPIIATQTNRSSNSSIIYNNSTIAQPFNGSKLCTCKGDKMATTLDIGNKRLTCAGDIMPYDVCVTNETVVADIYNTNTTSSASTMSFQARPSTGGSYSAQALNYLTIPGNARAGGCWNDLSYRDDMSFFINDNEVFLKSKNLVAKVIKQNNQTLVPVGLASKSYSVIIGNGNGVTISPMSFSSATEPFIVSGGTDFLRYVTVPSKCRCGFYQWDALSSMGGSVFFWRLPSGSYDAQVYCPETFGGSRYGDNAYVNIIGNDADIPFPSWASSIVASQFIW